MQLDVYPNNGVVPSPKTSFVMDELLVPGATAHSGNVAFAMRYLLIFACRAGQIWIR
jgi:hypothetical protein